MSRSLLASVFTWRNDKLALKFEACWTSGCVRVRVEVGLLYVLFLHNIFHIFTPVWAQGQAQGPKWRLARVPGPAMAHAATLGPGPGCRVQKCIKM